MLIAALVAVGLVGALVWAMLSGAYDTPAEEKARRERRFSPGTPGGAPDVSLIDLLLGTPVPPLEMIEGVPVPPPGRQALPDPGRQALPGIATVSADFTCTLREMDETPTHHQPVQCGPLRTVRVGNAFEGRSAFAGQACVSPQRPLTMVHEDIDGLTDFEKFYQMLHTLACLEGRWEDVGLQCPGLEGEVAITPFGRPFAVCKNGSWSPV